ncbi:hypothetical protein PR202_gb07944 [Eleusine coracana subsp. coracana]|uniref:Uncharacterized protein n=1 Tax=Eleusine coracana subsp. coracana TaxID=191504 RepID=A0AAV5ECP4_ELECO|nr:hypothetical protein PR202_gb07944 [Eleusine coracana subsp. coracana]
MQSTIAKESRNFGQQMVTETPIFSSKPSSKGHGKTKSLSSSAHQVTHSLHLRTLLRFSQRTSRSSSPHNYLNSSMTVPMTNYSR